MAFTITLFIPPNEPTGHREIDKSNQKDDAPVDEHIRPDYPVGLVECRIMNCHYQICNEHNAIPNKHLGTQLGFNPILCSVQ